MCAIFGFAGQTGKGQWQQTYDLLTALFIESQSRGKDASGFAACLSPYADPAKIGAITSKSPRRAADFIRTDDSWQRLQHLRCNALIGHTRWATHGSPFANANNHPHHGSGLSLVHNGVLRNHRKTADRLGLPLQTQCDSELLVRIVESSSDAVDGTLRCLTECDGSIAVAVLVPQERTIVIARNSGRPIHIMRLKGDSRTFFASTEIILLSALRKTFGDDVISRIDLLIPLAAGSVHMLRSDGSLRMSRSSVNMASP